MTYQDLEEEYNYEQQNNRELMRELIELKGRTCKDCKFFTKVSEYKDISYWDGFWKDLGRCSENVSSGAFSSTVSIDFCCNRFVRKYT